MRRSSLTKIPFINYVDRKTDSQEVTIQEIEHPIKLVLYMGDHLEDVPTIMEKLQQTNTLEVAYHAHEQCLFMNPKGIHKAATIVDQIGHDYIAFGNDQNDIDMFKQAQVAVQIGDFDVLKPYADYQIDVDDNFVSKIDNILTQFQD